MNESLQALSDLLDGNLPPSDSPTHKLERPGYKRDGLYGATPFKSKQAPIIVALTTEQACKHCGSTWMGFGGLYLEHSGTGLLGAMAMRSLIKEAPKDKIEKVIHTREEVPYCPNCLGKGDPS